MTCSLLLLILTGAAAVRGVHLNRACYFFDETWFDELSTGRGSLHSRLPANTLLENIPRVTSLNGAEPWWKIWSSLDHVTHPPLYMIILRAWREVFGESPIISRACSVVFSVIAVLLLFDVARLLHGARTALWACAIMAVAAPQVALAQEVRGYTLLLALCLAAMSALIRIEKVGTNPYRLAALSAAMLGMVLTHYFAIPAASALGLYATLRLRGAARQRVLLAMSASAAIFIIAWGPFLWEQRGNFTSTGDNWLSENPTGHITRDLHRLALLPHQLILEPHSEASPIAYLTAALLVIPFMLLRRRPELLLWCLWLCGTLFFIASIDLLRSTLHMAYIRYALIAGPAIYVLLASLLDGAGSPPMLRKAGPVLLGGLFAGCALALPRAYNNVNVEYRGLSAFLDSKIDQNDAVIFYCSDREDWFPSVLYLNTSYYSRTYPWPFMMINRPADAALLEQLRKFKGVWLVSGTASVTGDTLFPGATIIARQSFRGIGTCERFVPDATGELPTSRAAQASPLPSTQP